MSDTPAWYQIALHELGIHETPGPKATARIVEYHAATTLKATSDEIPWCSSFLCWCIAQAGLHPTGSAAAHSWATWGEPSPLRTGAIVVLQHKQAGGDKTTGSNSGYHVAFSTGELSETHVRLLGGNQHDSVRFSDFPLSDYAVRAIRWPAQGLPLVA